MFAYLHVMFLKRERQALHEMRIDETVPVISKMIRGRQLELTDLEFIDLKTKIEEYITKDNSFEKNNKSALNMALSDYINKSHDSLHVKLGFDLDKKLNAYEAELWSIIDQGDKDLLPGKMSVKNVFLPNDHDFREEASFSWLPPNFFTLVTSFESSLYNAIRKYHTQKSNEKMIHEEKLGLKKAKREILRLISYEAYAESSPQAILQATTLWKRPLTCITVNTGNG